MVNKSALCKPESKSNIFLRFIIVLFLIWITLLIVQEYTGTSLGESITTVQNWLLIIGLAVILSILPLTIMRRNSSNGNGNGR